jgi:hypothetical protein
MFRTIQILFGLTALVALSALPAGAVTCAADNVPAATLLLPYFEVDLSSRTGADTIFSINNAYADAAIAKVEVWTDLGVPIFGFNVYLTGYDVEVIDLRDILLYGILPDTMTGSPPPSCPKEALAPGPLPAATLADYQSAFTGNPVPSLGGKCAAVNRGDKIARGYITVDSVTSCTTQLPTTPGYFAGVAGTANVLWGDFSLVNLDRKEAFGDPLVHIEADTASAETAVAGNYTFYGRYIGWNASDRREPLPTTFGARYTNLSPFDGDGDLIVWRDPKVNQLPFTCPVSPGVRPAWYPLGQEVYLAFDEQENAVAPHTRPFPAATQRVPVSSLGLPYGAGWLFLNLNASVAAAGSNPPEDPRAAQAWVMTVMSDKDGVLKSGYDAMQYDSACRSRHFKP